MPTCTAGRSSTPPKPGPGTASARRSASRPETSGRGRQAPLRRPASRSQLSNPFKTGLIAKASVKTDKVDARALAGLLRSGMLATCHIGTADERGSKQLFRYQMGLVRDRTGVINSTRSLLDKYDVDPKKGGRTIWRSQDAGVPGHDTAGKPCRPVRPGGAPVQDPPLQRGDRQGQLEDQGVRQVVVRGQAPAEPHGDRHVRRRVSGI